MSELIFKQHHSQLDQSVNFEHRFEDHAGMLEARYVRRTDEYFIVYLSSQTGCKQACRMCWLTATGQTDLRDTTIEEYFQQAEEVFAYYDTQTPTKMVHFNFMARGEPLANKIFLANADEILRGLKAMADKRGLEVKFKISTIFPREMGTLELTDIFKDPTVYPDIYYSIYSTSIDFRRRWVPKAQTVAKGGSELRRWFNVTGKRSKIHYAFIEGENDTLVDVMKVIRLLHAYDINPDWNIVRYNPPVGHSSKEPSERHIKMLAEYIQHYISGKVKVIPRVGTDVQASCGTFLK